jgi:hypothetical protein
VIVVVTDPHANESRRHKEAAIRTIDLLIYAATAAGGFFALAITPDSVQRALEGWEWLATAWGLLLILSGTFGFVGRLTRVWLIEIPAPLAAVFGGLIYLLVLGATAPDKPTAWVAVALTFIATAGLFRRFIELQIFTSEPGSQTLADRLQAILRRRTSNAVPHK